MAYSRWSHSKWYSYWSADSGDTKNEEALALFAGEDYNKQWSYRELLDFDVQRVLEEYDEATVEEAEEAMEYIREFLDDVNDSYNH